MGDSLIYLCLSSSSFPSHPFSSSPNRHRQLTFSHLLPLPFRSCVVLQKAAKTDYIGMEVVSISIAFSHSISSWSYLRMQSATSSAKYVPGFLRCRNTMIMCALCTHFQKCRQALHQPFTEYNLDMAFVVIRNQLDDLADQIAETRCLDQPLPKLRYNLRT